MKMKKIKGIEKSICTCEQKIAYNYAFMYHTQLKQIFISDITAIAKSEAYQKVVNFVIEGIKRNGIDKKYNIDAIVHCFRNGIENYMNFNNSGVIGSYEEIGKTFPCLYEVE